MFQIRLKEGVGSDKWVNPARDLVFAFPRMMKKVFSSFNEFKGVPGCTMEQMCDFAGRMAKMQAAVIRDPKSHFEFAEEVRQLEAPCPACFSEVSRVAMHTLAGVYAVWVADAKHSDDTEELPVWGLDRVAEDLAARAQRKRSWLRRLLPW